MPSKSPCREVLSGRAREFFLPLILIRNLKHTYDSPGITPVPALNGIDLDIEEGEYIALVGPNGSGKTTLARHLNGGLLPTEGSVEIDGTDTKDPAGKLFVRSTVGMVFQSPEDQIVSTIVEEDVAFGPENIGVGEEILPRLVENSLRQVGMWHARSRSTHMLSAGEQQRVAIAGVLALQPRCLVFDEATAMLDPRGASDIHSILHELNGSGKTVLHITHRMEEAALARRVVILEKGRLVRDGSARDVLSDTSIKSYGLNLPQAADLAVRIRLRLPKLPGNPINIPELVDALEGML